MRKKLESEEKAKEYFKKLGYMIKERDEHGNKIGADFFIKKDGKIHSVEVKTSMMHFLEPQLRRIKKDGLIAIWNGKKITIKTKDDIKKIKKYTSYFITFK